MNREELAKRKKEIDLHFDRIQANQAGQMFAESGLETLSEFLDTVGTNKRDMLRYSVMPVFWEAFAKTVRNRAKEAAKETSE